MSRILVLSFIVASLSTVGVVGCGASATRPTATPSSDNVRAPEARDEACWTPPEEVAMQMNETAKEPESTPLSEKQRLESSYRPNRQERPAAGAVHAATY